MGGKMGKSNPTIADYFAAGFPCLFLRTVEPQIAEDLVLEALKDLEAENMAYGVWRATTGFVVKDSYESTAHGKKTTKEFVPALHYIHEEAEKDIYKDRGEDSPMKPITAIFYNIRKLIDNYQAIQQMVDTINVAELVGSHIVIIGPMLELPPELRELVQVVDVPLPRREKLEEEFHKLVAAYDDDDDLALPPKGEKRDELIKAAANAAVGLPLMSARNAISLSMAAKDSIDLQLIQKQKEQEIKKSDVLEFISPRDTIDDVGDFDVFKDWLAERKMAFTEEAREYGLPYPKGILIVGIPRTGKSLAAKAVGHFLQVPLLQLDMGRVFKSLVGSSEESIRTALRVAEAVSPCVLWVDELEKGMAGMASSGELDSGVTARVVSTFLTWRQETDKPVFLVATANNVATIPPMVYGKGRIDEVWATGLPRFKGREEIFRIHLRKNGRDPNNFDVNLLAQNTEGYVGAEIEAAVIDGMFSAFASDVEVKTKHILVAIKKMIPQSERDAETINLTQEWVKDRARLVSSEREHKNKSAVVRELKRTTNKKEEN